jgi:hypothetical protein
LAARILNCRSCGGAGFTVYSSGTVRCAFCRGTGRRRARLVLTVVNVDTGTAASLDVVPGTLRPHAVSGRWRVDLMHLVRELAARVGAASFHELRRPDRPVRPVDELPLYLPGGWQPDLPPDRRLAAEATAIAGGTGPPWRVYLGRSTVEPAPDPDRRLSELCALADRLCLDLVVEACLTPWSTMDGGGLDWDIRYELPGGMPARFRLRYSDLPAAVAATRPREALHRLFGSNSPAPAHWIVPPPSPEPTTADADQVERRLVALCTGGLDDLGTPAAGAQAVRRDGHWYWCGLRGMGVTDSGTPEYARAYEPAEPSYLDGPIPDGEGLVVTVTDLAGRVAHANWHADAALPTALVGTQPGGQPVVQLAEEFRLARWATPFGVRPEHLFDAHSDHPADLDLREGVVTVTDPGRTPVGQYLARASRGRPGGRLLVVAAPPEVPSLAQVARVAFGLGLAVEVAVRNHRLDAGDPCKVHGEHWRVDLVTKDRPVLLDPPYKESLEQAIGYCWTNLEEAVTAAVAVDPAVPAPAPQQALPPDLGKLDLGRLPGVLSRVGDHHAGAVVVLRLDPDGHRLYLGDGLKPLADSSTPALR